MAATPLTLNALGRAGTAPAVATAADLTNGNSVPNGRGVGLMLVVNNAGASAATITFVTPSTVSSLNVADHSVSVSAGTTLHFSNFDQSAFGSTLTFTASAALDVTAYRVPATA